MAILPGRHIAQLTRHFHVGGVLRETDRHVVGLKTHCCADVFHVLGSQRRRAEPAAAPVDALVVRQLAAEVDRGVNRVPTDRIDSDHDQAVVEQEHIAGPDLAWQRLVVQSHGVNVTQFGSCSIEHKFLPDFKHDLAQCELAHPDLGTLQVRDDGDFAANTQRDFTHQTGPLNMVLRRAVTEIESHHIDAGAKHLLQQGRIAAGRPQRGDDLGGAPRYHAAPAARRVRISKAGRVLPSSTSRKAPPPVEM